MNNKIVILVAEDGKLILCYVCIDFPTQDVCIVHMHIPKGSRSSDNFYTMGTMFYSLLHPYLRNYGVKIITSNCLASDLKTTELIKYMGFKTETLTMGSMPVQEEQWQ